MKTKSAKEKILEAAATLFYNDGIANTGINTITDRAGVCGKCHCITTSQLNPL